MPQKAVPAIQAVHDRLMSRLEEESKRLDADLAKAPDKRQVKPNVLLKQHEELLENAKQRLTEAKQVRDAAVARLDQEIRRYEEIVKRLEKETADARKALGENKAPGVPDSNTRGARAEKRASEAKETRSK